MGRPTDISYTRAKMTREHRAKLARAERTNVEELSRNLGISFSRDIQMNHNDLSDAHIRMRMGLNPYRIY